MEYIDKQGGGCAWHGDPECLCDVERSKFVVGDGPYVVPPDMERRFRESAGPDDDQWFYESWDTMYGDTLLRGLDPKTVVRLASVIEGQPEVVQTLLDGAPVKAVNTEAGFKWGIASALAKVLVLAPHSRSGRQPRMEPIRAEALRLYDDEGLTTTAVRAALNERGAGVSQGLVTNWVRRFSVRWARENPEKAARIRHGEAA